MSSKIEKSIHLSNRKIRNDHYKTVRNIKKTNWEPLNAKGALKSVSGFFQSLGGGGGGGGGGGSNPGYSEGGSDPGYGGGSNPGSGGGGAGGTGLSSSYSAGATPDGPDTTDYSNNGDQKKKLIIPIVLACAVGAFLLFKGK
jgi:hypothetical protein